MAWPVEGEEEREQIDRASFSYFEARSGSRAAADLIVSKLRATHFRDSRVFHVKRPGRAFLLRDA
jgi:hypothetical protein